MISKVLSAAVIGLEAELIEVEADVTNGLPATIVVGLPDTAVQESRERVKTAIKNSGCSYPPTRVSVNLAPADVPKLGTHFDLPIALAIIMASDQTGLDITGKIFLGELSLDGKLRSVPGVLAAAIKAKNSGIKEIFVPKTNAKEAALVAGIKVYPAEDLKQLLGHLMGINPIIGQKKQDAGEILKNYQPSLDMEDVAGQELAKRALEIAAAGSHNILLFWSQSVRLAQYGRCQAELSPRTSYRDPALNGYLVAVENYSVDDRPQEFSPALMGEAREVDCRFGAVFGNCFLGIGRWHLC